MKDEKKQEELANSVRRLTQTVQEQFEGHYHELREHSRLLNKDKPVFSQFSVDKVTDADLTYQKEKKISAKKTATTTTAMEIKAISTAKAGSVSQVIKDAAAQLEGREADKKKVLVVITEPSNKWPVHGSKLHPTEADMKKAFETKIGGLNLAAPTQIRVQGISLDDASYTATAKKTGKSYSYSYEKELKHPSILSPMKYSAASSSIVNTNNSKGNNDSGSDTD